jgi:hypothetical protein
MALKATVFKADLQVANLDQNQFGDYSLTLAQHPSETIERVMIRLLAFALYASEDLYALAGVFPTKRMRPFGKLIPPASPACGLMWGCRTRHALKKLVAVPIAP